MRRTADRTLRGSFRDPSGYLFRHDGVLYRAIDTSYAPHYERFVESGLYQSLVDDDLLVEHEEVDVAIAPGTAWRCLRPRPIEFISYPFEWCFGQLRDAALLTLEVQRRALERGLVLKDASAYNVQFEGSVPVFIDTLSFERYEEGRPWVAYRQFCEHFLAVLALMRYRDPRAARWLAGHIDGIPLDLAAPLLPFRSRLRPGLFLHLHLHAGAQRRLGRMRGSRARAARRGASVSRGRLEALCDSLRSTVESLDWEPRTGWLDYYEESRHYSDAAIKRKADLVEEYLGEAEPATVWDLGANTGRFSEIASRTSRLTVSFDVDPGVVERLYRKCREEGRRDILPLVVDLANPSPAVGWAHEERESLLERGPADAVLALALVHHLRLSHNVPFSMIADFVRRAGRWAIVEFVPKDDPMVGEMLALRRDVFTDYTRAAFDAAFAEWFEVVRREAIPDTGRSLYLLRRRERRMP